MPSLAKQLEALEPQEPDRVRSFGPGSDSPLNTANWREMYNGDWNKDSRPVAAPRGEPTQLTNNPSEWRRLFNG